MRRFVFCLILFLTLTASIGDFTTAAESMPVQIGVLVPVDGPDKVSGDAVVAGVDQAVREWKRAHPSSPFSGLSIRVIPAQLRWGAQIDALVDAVLESRTLAVIGAADSRTAHLAAQVITRLKGETLLISLSDDPTLTEIGVPWILRFPAGAGDASRALLSRSALPGASVQGSVASPSALRGAAHDAARAVLGAFSGCGIDVAAIRSVLSSRTFRGTTGDFTFDASGNRTPAK